MKKVFNPYFTFNSLLYLLITTNIKLCWIGEADAPAELFHNAKQIEAERQKLFKKKLQQQQQHQSDSEPQELEARIPAPWDSHLEGTAAPPPEAEKWETTAATSQEEQRVETNALSQELGRKGATEVQLREEAPRGTEETPPQHHEDRLSSLGDTQEQEGTVADFDEKSLSRRGKNFGIF
jgi:hypothetical protein